MKLTPEQEFSLSPMNLDIVYEDEYILVINKEAGVLMHPTSTVRDHTLAMVFYITIKRQISIMIFIRFIDWIRIPLALLSSQKHL